ncbi:MAG: general secretion pathway protein GspK [Deltaproteobacteria bacterium]|nr:general secretion pathway protein GspK [Deltaproteobacteria bacterium]
MLRVRPLGSPRDRALPGQEKRGVALLMALIMVVLMTAYISEFNYTSRTRILSAAHARDDMRAQYLATSGVRVYTLLLAFGNMIGSNQFMQGMMTNLGLPPIDGATMICSDLPGFDTAFLRFLIGSEGMASDEQEEGMLDILGLGEGASEAPQRGEVNAIGSGSSQPSLRRAMFDFEGDFKVECSDETAKIDLNGLAEPAFFTLPLQHHPIALMLYGQMAPEEYDPLFEERLKIDRWELIANIKDYIDGDTVRSHTFGGDEERPYDNFEPRYEPKDKLFDTVQESRMVAGVTDEVFGTFAEGWSVKNRTYQVNVNTAEPGVLWAVVRALTDPSLVSPQMIDARMAIMSIERQIMPFRDKNDFENRIANGLPAGLGNGAQVDPLALHPDQSVRDRVKNLIKTKSNTFRLTSTGYYGDSARIMDVTVRMRRDKPRYLDWRER